MTRLERRCRLLLRAYPASYRAARGDELIATLLDTGGPDRAWPTWREAGALVFGGLRVRARQHHRLTTAANLRLSVMLGIAASIGFLGSSSAGRFGLLVEINNPITLRGGGDLSGSWARLPLGSIWPVACAVALTVLAPAAAWIGRRAVAVPVLLAAAAVLPFAELSRGREWPGEMLAAFLPLSLLFVALAVVTALGTDRLPRAWLWWYGLPPAWILDERVANSLPFVVGRVLVGLPLFPLFVLGAIVWVIVDARPAIALAVMLATLAVISAAGDLGPWAIRQQLDLRFAAVYLAAGLVLAASALLRMRRQAVL